MQIFLLKNSNGWKNSHSKHICEQFCSKLTGISFYLHHRHPKLCNNGLSHWYLELLLRVHFVQCNSLMGHISLHTEGEISYYKWCVTLWHFITYPVSLSVCPFPVLTVLSAVLPVWYNGKKLAGLVCVFNAWAFWMVYCMPLLQLNGHFKLWNKAIHSC